MRRQLERVHATDVNTGTHNRGCCALAMSNSWRHHFLHLQLGMTRTAHRPDSSQLVPLPHAHAFLLRFLDLSIVVLASWRKHQCLTTCPRMP
jgi:hypothetical protein